MAKLNQNDRKGGPRRTTVVRTPYWKPSESQWTFIPTGPTHNQKVEFTDPEAMDLGARELDQYESKGWVSLYRVPDDDPRRDLLPENYQELMRDHKAQAVMPDQKVVKAAFEKLGAEPPAVDAVDDEESEKASA